MGEKIMIATLLTVIYTGIIATAFISVALFVTGACVYSAYKLATKLWEKIDASQG